MHKRILLAGGGLQAISAARSLYEINCVVGIWTTAREYATKSSAISIIGISNDNKDINSLMEFIEQTHFDVIIPMSDAYCDLLSKHKYEIEFKTKCKVAAPNYEVLKIASDKENLMKFCDNNKFPHPITFSESELNDLKDNDIPYPMLIKPNHSVGSRGITLVKSKNELLTALPKIKAEFGNCHLQEYIDGALPYYNVMLYRNQNGDCVNSTVLKIIRFYPVNGGSSSMCESIDYPELVKICSEVLDKLNYIGFADFDVLQSINGDLKIIEINPRVPASLRGAYISGVNFPAIIVADNLGLEIPNYTYSSGKVLRYLGLDLMWFISSNERFKAKPSWFKFWGKNIFYQEGGFKDFRPMIASIIGNFKKIHFRNGKLTKRTTI